MHLDVFDQPEKNYFFNKEISGSQKTEGILEIYRDLKIDELTRVEIEFHHQNALAILNSFQFGHSTKEGLLKLMDEMLTRER